METVFNLEKGRMEREALQWCGLCEAHAGIILD